MSFRCLALCALGILTAIGVANAGEIETLEDGREFLHTLLPNGLEVSIVSDPELELVACHDFRYQIDETRELDDAWEDIVLVLKKR